MHDSEEKNKTKITLRGLDSWREEDQARRREASGGRERLQTQVPHADTTGANVTCFLLPPRASSSAATLCNYLRLYTGDKQHTHFGLITGGTTLLVWSLARLGSVYSGQRLDAPSGCHANETLTLSSRRWRPLRRGIERKLETRVSAYARAWLKIARGSTFYERARRGTGKLARSAVTPRGEPVSWLRCAYKVVFMRTRRTLARRSQVNGSPGPEVGTSGIREPNRRGEIGQTRGSQSLKGAWPRLAAFLRRELDVKVSRSQDSGPAGRAGTGAGGRTAGQVGRGAKSWSSLARPSNATWGSQNQLLSPAFDIAALTLYDSETFEPSMVGRVSTPTRGPQPNAAADEAPLWLRNGEDGLTGRRVARQTQRRTKDSTLQTSVSPAQARASSGSREPQGRRLPSGWKTPRRRRWIAGCDWAVRYSREVDSRRGWGRDITRRGCDLSGSPGPGTGTAESGSRRAFLQRELDVKVSQSQDSGPAGRDGLGAARIKSCPPPLTLSAVGAGKSGRHGGLAAIWERRAAYNQASPDPASSEVAAFTSYETGFLRSSVQPAGASLHQQPDMATDSPASPRTRGTLVARERGERASQKAGVRSMAETSEGQRPIDVCLASPRSGELWLSQAGRSRAAFSAGNSEAEAVDRGLSSAHASRTRTVTGAQAADPAPVHHELGYARSELGLHGRGGGAVETGCSNFRAGDEAFRQRAQFVEGSARSSCPRTDEGRWVWSEHLDRWMRPWRRGSAFGEWTGAWTVW
ncbi:hypothetical protein V8D89_007390 [Ganoderma adspersum]